MPQRPCAMPEAKAVLRTRRGAASPRRGWPRTGAGWRGIAKFVRRASQEEECLCRTGRCTFSQKIEQIRFLLFYWGGGGNNDDDDDYFKLISQSTRNENKLVFFTQNSFFLSVTDCWRAINSCKWVTTQQTHNRRHQLAPLLKEDLSFFFFFRRQRRLQNRMMSFAQMFLKSHLDILIAAVFFYLIRISESPKLNPDHLFTLIASSKVSFSYSGIINRFWNRFDRFAMTTRRQ